MNGHTLPHNEVRVRAVDCGGLVRWLPFIGRRRWVAEVWRWDDLEQTSFTLGVFPALTRRRAVRTAEAWERET